MQATPSSSITQLNTSPVHRVHSTSPYKTARFSPYKLRKARSVLHLADHSQAHPNLPPPTYNLPGTSGVPHFIHEGLEYEPTRHIRLDFELYQDGEQITPSKEQYDKIMSLFPTCFKLSFQPPFLVVACTTLPAKPWPVTLAGLPLYLTTDGAASPMNRGQTAFGPKASIDAIISRWNTPDLETFKKLFDFFDLLDANIQRLQWIGWCFLALGPSEPHGDWKKRLPFTVNNIVIGYIFGEQAMHEKALRRKLPLGRIPDGEAYESLRPGVMVASQSLGNEDYDVMTTSGICLQSPSGRKYITVAKHGFPGGVGDQVLHPNRHGRSIAEVAKVFGKTDIALAELKNVQYSKETFSTHDAPVSPFRSILGFIQLRSGDPIYMDTPYNGRCEGVLMKVDVHRIIGEGADEQEYVVGAFGYFGNGGDTLFDGCCGGVIWNSNHDVLGQFRYQQDGLDNLCYCPTFSMLQSLGYTVAEA